MQAANATLPLSLILLGLASTGCGQAPHSYPTDLPESDGGAGPLASTRGPHRLGETSRAHAGNTATLEGSAGEGGSADPSRFVADAARNVEGASDGPPDPTAAPPGTDLTPPRVVRIHPENGAVGVPATSAIVIEFSEPMEREATEGAFASHNLPGVHHMTWNDAGTIMTVTHGVPLEYAKASLTDVEPLELAAKTYDYALTGLASDRAGNRLAETRVHFATLREVTHTLLPLQALTGAIRATNDEHAPLHGFVTFDATVPPNGIVGLQRAVAELGPYSLNHAVPVFHVDFDELSAAAITAPAKSLGVLPSGTSGAFVISPAASGFLRRVYLARTSAQHYLQFRLDLPTSVSNVEPAVVDRVLQHTSLVLDYLLP